MNKWLAFMRKGYGKKARITPFLEWLDCRHSGLDRACAVPRHMARHTW